MNDDIGIDKQGVTLHWHLLTKWGWRVLEVLIAMALSGQIVVSHNRQLDVHKQQEVQDKRLERQEQRMERIERAVEACLAETAKKREEAKSNGHLRTTPAR